MRAEREERLHPPETSFGGAAPGRGGWTEPLSRKPPRLLLDRWPRRWPRLIRLRAIPGPASSSARARSAIARVHGGSCGGPRCRPALWSRSLLRIPPTHPSTIATPLLRSRVRVRGVRHMAPHAAHRPALRAAPRRPAAAHTCPGVHCSADSAGETGRARGRRRWRMQGGCRGL